MGIGLPADWPRGVRVIPSGPSRRAGADGELLGNLRPKPPDKRLVDTRRGTHAGTASKAAS